MFRILTLCRNELSGFGTRWKSEKKSFFFFLVMTELTLNSINLTFCHLTFLFLPLPSNLPPSFLPSLGKHLLVTTYSVPGSCARLQRWEKKNIKWRRIFFYISLYTLLKYLKILPTNMYHFLRYSKRTFIKSNHVILKQNLTKFFL